MDAPTPDACWHWCTSANVGLVVRVRWVRTATLSFSLSLSLEFPISPSITSTQGDPWGSCLFGARFPHRLCESLGCAQQSTTSFVEKQMSLGEPFHVMREERRWQARPRSKGALQLLGPGQNPWGSLWGLGISRRRQKHSFKASKRAVWVPLILTDSKRNIHTIDPICLRFSCMW